MQDNTSVAQADMKARLRTLLDKYGKTVYDSAYQKTGDAILARTVTVRVFRELYKTMYAQTDERSMDAWVHDVTSRELADIALSELMIEKQTGAAPASEEIAAEIAISPQVTAAAAAAAAVLEDAAPVSRPERAKQAHAAQTQGYDRAAHERATEPKKRSHGMDWFWGVMLFIGTAVLVWAIAGLLMAQGILPQLDLGYSALGIF